ncbi:MAG: hypothetical protein KDK53_06440 [Maritimibacter sp.]|nr:hypothetical protein [Maritimibacter sp.]
MNVPAALPHRADARTTARGALAIFLPLFAGLLWWAAAHSMAGLPTVWAVAAALVAAAGPAVWFAELLANATRLPVVFHFHWSRVVHAALLGFATPVAVIHGFPTVAGPTALVGLFGGLGAGLSFAESLAGILALLVVVPLAALAWYPTVCLLASGITDHRRRFAVFVLLWWSVYAALALFGIWLIPMALV